MLRKIVSIILCLFMVAGSVNPQKSQPLFALDDAYEGVYSDESVDYPSTTDSDFDISQIAIKTEVLSERTATTKTFRKVDGTFEVSVYDDVIHYYENGEWKEIDNSLNDLGDELETKDNAFKLKFPKYLDDNKQIKLTMGDYGIDWNVLDIESSAIEYDDSEISASNIKELTSINQSVLYSNVQNNVDIEYIVTGSKVKENIILNQYVTDFSMTFEYKLKDLTIKEDDNGNLIFVNEEDEIVFSFSDLYMFDDEMNETSDIEYQLVDNGNKTYEITIVPSDEWLESASYPVTIDPTITFENGSSMIQDKYVYHSYSANNTYLKVGLYEYYEYYYRSYMQFDLTQLPDNVKVDYAHLTLTSYDNNVINDGTIVAKEVKATEPYSGINAELLNVTETRAIDYANVEYSDGDSGTYSFDLTAAFAKWVDNGDVSRSIELSMLNESNPGYIIFRSNNNTTSVSPKLEIGYTYTNGLKDYWTYNSQDIGRVGTGYVSDYTGFLTFVRNDFNFETNKQSLGLNFAYSNQDGAINNWYGNGWNPSYNTRIDYNSTLEEFYTEDYTGNIVYYNRTSEYNYRLDIESNHEYDCFISEDGSGALFVYDFDTVNFTEEYYILGMQGEKYIYPSASSYLEEITYSDSSLFISIQRNSTNPEKIEYVKDTSDNYLRFVYDTSNDRISEILLRTAAIEVSDPNMTNGDYLEKVVFGYETGTDNVTQVYHYNNYDQNELNDEYDLFQYTYVSNKLYSAFISGGEKVIYTYEQGSDRVEVIENYFDSSQFSEVTYTYQFRQTMITDHTDDFVVYKFDAYGHTVNIIDRYANTAYYGYIDIFNGTSGSYNYLQNHALLSQSTPEKMTYNQVENYNFEYSFSTDDWYSYEYIAPSQSTNSPYLGDYSLYTFHFTSTGGYMYQDIFLNEGVYSLIAMVRNSSSSDTGAYIGVDDVISSSVDAGNGWQEVYVPISIESDNTQITIKLHNHTCGGVYFDNVRIVPGINDSRINIVENASFEFGGTAAWNSIDTSFSTYYSINDGNSDYNTTFEWILGEYGRGIEGSPTEIREISQTIDASEFTTIYGGTFYIGGWANTYSAPFVSNTNYDEEKIFRIYVEFLDSSDAVIDYDEICFNQSLYSWQYVYGEITAPSSYAKVKISFQYQGLGEVLVDGLSVFFKEDKTEYEYDTQGRVETIDFGDGRTYTYHYPDSETSIPDTVTDENGNITNIEESDGEVEYVITRV